MRQFRESRKIRYNAKNSLLHRRAAQQVYKYLFPSYLPRFKNPSIFFVAVFLLGVKTKQLPRSRSRPTVIKKKMTGIYISERKIRDGGPAWYLGSYITTRSEEETTLRFTSVERKVESEITTTREFFFSPFRLRKDKPKAVCGHFALRETRR